MFELPTGVVQIHAPAKVNLFLEVLGRRADGYHEVATLMVKVGLCDVLDIFPAPPGEFRLSVDAPNVPDGPDNLVWRAADLLRSRTGHAGGASVRLRKRIPTQAGLGGGSSDCAAALGGLNRLWGLGLSREELAGLGAELGSDVPFFVADAPAAWCSGRGEVVEPERVGASLHLVVARPPVGLSTARVYANVTPPRQPRDGSDARAALRAGDIEALGRALHNRLQGPAEGLEPEVARCRAALAAAGPLGSLMSGSGSAVFALCRDRRDAERVASLAGGNARAEVSAGTASGSD